MAGDPSSSGHNSLLDVIMGELSTEMAAKFQDGPKLLRKTAGDSCCCIFRVPQSHVDINDKAYQPRIVSIGPYHHGGGDHLKMIEEHKWQYLSGLVHRMEQKGHTEALSEFLIAIAKEETKIRNSYSEELDDDKFNSKGLAQMMVLDGIFIIELLCKVGSVVSHECDDPIFNMEWVLPFLHRDLMVLENQIPFSVLEILFALSAPSRTNDRPLTKLALGFFNLAVQRPEQVISSLPDDLNQVHLLDLFRLSFIHSLEIMSLTNVSNNTSLNTNGVIRNNNTSQGPSNNTNSKQESSFHRLIRIFSCKEMSTSSSSVQAIQLAQSAKKLRRSGIRFKVRSKVTSFLDIEYEDGVLKIPELTVDDMSRAFLLNFVAFEQCYKHCSKRITEYATFMGCLINTPGDAEYLCDRQVIENYIGTDDEVAELFNNIRKDVSVDLKVSYLSKVYADLNKRRGVRWWVWWTDLWDTYFDSPWSFLKLFAATTLLGLTATQVYYAVHPDNKQNL